MGISLNALTGALIACVVLAVLISVAVRWRTIAALNRPHAVFGSAVDAIIKDAERRARDAETKLREITDERLQLAHEVSNLALWDWNVASGEIYLSRHWGQMLGGAVTETRTTLEDLTLLVHADDREGVRQAIQQAFKGAAGTYSVQHRVRTASGEWMWIESHGKVVARGESGRAVRMTGTHADITDSKHIEAELKESEERFRQFSESINVGFWILDLNPRRVTYVNRAFIHISGLAADEVYRHPGPRIDVVHEDDQQAVKLAFEEWLQGNPSAGLEIDYRIVRPDGKMRWIHDHGVKLQDVNGQTFRIIGISEDITDRKLVEEELRQTRTFLESIIENIPNMICVKDAKELRYVQLNRAGEELLGYSREAIIGKNDYDFFPKSEVDFFVMKDRQVLDGGVLVDIPEEPIQTRARGLRYLHTKKLPILDKSGQPRYLLGISEDITNRKRTDEAVKAMNRALERKAGELANANQELEAFAYSVSHDLRAPLRHIDGYLNLLQKRVGPLLDEISQRYVATISRAAARMASLIDDLLAFSRMGRTELNKRVVPLNSLIKEVINDLRAETENRDIDWIVKPLPNIFGDAALFRQAFFNLIENAVKYTGPRQHARIEIGSIQHDREEVVISISDNGVGFDMKYVDKLFGVFQRLHRAEEFEGTGIGLANVARIIQRHGGRVWAVGEKDQGATFYVAIPLEEKVKHD